MVILNGLPKATRRILFLTHDDSTTRSVADLYGTSILVRRHGTPDLRLYNDSPLTEKIARFLLTPAAGEDPRVFGGTVTAATADALKAAGYNFVASLLRNLVGGGSGLVRDEACLAYYEQLFGDDSCLKDVNTSNSNLAARIMRARQHREYVHTLLFDAIRSNVGFSLTRCGVKGVEPTDPESRAELLEYLLKNADPLIRVGAGMELSTSVRSKQN